MNSTLDRRVGAVRAGRGAARTAGGFTLVELMIVIVIISVIIAVLFPALGGAKKTTRTAATKAMLSEVQSACGQFILDNRRPPGYFTPVEMGDPQNGTDTAGGRGFTGMENILLDLSGGIVPNGATAGTFQVGPKASLYVNVDPTLIGATSAAGVNKHYYTPPAKFFVTAPDRAHKDTTWVNGLVPVPLPDLVDAFGSPILAWSQDETAPSKSKMGIIDTSDSFGPGKFYWASNSAFLRARKLGTLGQDQYHATDSVAHSLIGGGRGQTQIRGSMTAILGNPAYPDSTGNDCNVPRGSIILHSAGPDGLYVGSTDRGGKLAASNPGPLAWTIRYNFPRAQGNETQTDSMAAFDDVLVKGDGGGG